MSVSDNSENPREGTEAHDSALRRLDTARTGQREKREAHDETHDPVAEREAASDLAEANEELAAREAWVKWIERGY
jgi:hypothetical protein